MHKDWVLSDPDHISVKSDERARYDVAAELPYSFIQFSGWPEKNDTRNSYLWRHTAQVPELKQGAVYESWPLRHWVTLRA